MATYRVCKLQSTSTSVYFFTPPLKYQCKKIQAQCSEQLLILAHVWIKVIQNNILTLNFVLKNNNTYQKRIVLYKAKQYMLTKESQE